MTSKKSFLVSLKTNLKRRVWLIVVMILALTFAMPTYLAMALSTEKMNYRGHDLPIQLGKIFAGLAGINEGICILVGVLAVVAALQGFSYMYQQKKLDMYMSVPVSKKRRFAVIYLNGIFVFIIPYLVNLALSFLVGQVMGADVRLGLEEAAAAVIGNSIFYLAVYHTVILAVMLTGNLFVTLLGSGVLLFYDIAVLSIITSYMGSFFSSYYYKSSIKLENLLISPVSRFVRACNDAFTYDYRYMQIRTLHWDRFLKSMLILLVIAVLILLLSYWCYTKKPAEACKRAMAFPKTKAVIKVFLTAAAGLAAGIMFYAMSGLNKVFLVFGLLVGTLLCHGVVEVIYDFDIRSVKNGWRSLAVSGGVVAVVFGIFQFDVFQYDRYVPQASEVESIAFVFVDDYTTFYDENLDGVGSEEYAFRNMKITDIAPVLELAERRMGLEEPLRESGMVYRTCLVKYDLKNGKEVYRKFPTACLEDEELLNAVVTNKAYQEAAYLIYNEPVMALSDQVKISYDSGAELKAVSGISLEQIKNAYVQDLEGLDFTDIMEERVQGRFQLEYISGNDYVTAYLPVYPSFERINEMLKKEGLYKKYYADPEKIERIMIRNDNNELYERYSEDGYILRGEFSVEESFEDKDEIARIVPALYPDTYDYWIPNGVLNTGFYATIVYKSGEEIEQNNYVAYYMLDDKIPDFVRERTAYSE